MQIIRILGITETVFGIVFGRSHFFEPNKQGSGFAMAESPKHLQGELPQSPARDCRNGFLCPLRQLTAEDVLKRLDVENLSTVTTTHLNIFKHEPWIIFIGHDVPKQSGIPFSTKRI